MIVERALRVVMFVYQLTMQGKMEGRELWPLEALPWLVAAGCRSVPNYMHSSTPAKHRRQQRQVCLSIETLAMAPKVVAPAIATTEQQMLAQVALVPVQARVQ